MPITHGLKERRIPLEEYFVEGVDSGLFDDLTYRPNKYFEAIEQIRLEEGDCVVRYQREFSPVEGKVSLREVKDVLLGVIDGLQLIAHDQICYLYPGIEAFGLDRRRSLRVGLINVRPHKDRERSSQELCVDAFLQLIAEHCPEAQTRVVAYNGPIFTLRHLRQVLDRRPPSPWVRGGLFLLVFLLIVFAILHQFGPPPIRQPLRRITGKVTSLGKRLVRSGSEEWFRQIRQDRKRWDRRYQSVPYTLVLLPDKKTIPPATQKRWRQALGAVLQQEFPNRHTIIEPQGRLSRSQQRVLAALCPPEQPGMSCPPGSLIIQVKGYRGGSRPLVEALREALQKKLKGPHLQVKYLRLGGFARLSIVSLKKGAATRPASLPAPTNGSSPPTKDRPTAPLPRPAPRTTPGATPPATPRSTAPPLIPPGALPRKVPPRPDAGSTPLPARPAVRPPTPRPDRPPVTPAPSVAPPPLPPRG